MLCQLPVIIEFVALTYAVGAFLESGILASIGGNVAVVIAYVAANRYQWDFYSTVYKYFLPARIGSLLYVSRYDTVFNTPEFIAKHGSMYVNDTFESCATWIAVTLGISAVLILYSFISTWRRKI